MEGMKGIWHLFHETAARIVARTVLRQWQGRLHDRVRCRATIWHAAWAPARAAASSMAVLGRRAACGMGLGFLRHACGAVAAVGTWLRAAQHIFEFSLTSLGVEPIFLQMRLDVLRA